MAAKKKKIGAAGRYGAGYGRNVRFRLNTIESSQRQTQPSPFHPTGRAKRISAGIWKCLKTGKIFAGHAYYLKEKK
ncbi:MAG: 50S ribosomal protein L37ae [Nanoarchaeota archaeon]|nr:50S ribosomal protein L37ae [Nanoarchaeota archaeon]MBU0977561.1 50S ribosomal protein L37ae [Nanoarchaeota archaeon]